jgi:hypothetical protein
MIARFGRAFDDGCVARFTDPFEAGAFDIACEREIGPRPDIKSFHPSVAAQRRQTERTEGHYLKLSNGEIIELRANFQNETCKPKTARTSNLTVMSRVCRRRARFWDRRRLKLRFA